MSYRNLVTQFAYDDFNESKHPRGQPGNAGQFSSSPGGGGFSEHAAPKAATTPGSYGGSGGSGGSSAKLTAPIVNTHVKKALLEQGFKKAKSPPSLDHVVMFEHKGSNVVVAIHPSPKGLSSSSKWHASNGAEGDGGKSLNEFLAKHVIKSEAAKPSMPIPAAPAAKAAAPVPETTSHEKFKNFVVSMYGTTYGNPKSDETFVTWEKSNGDKIELNKNTHEWLAVSQGHLTKTGKGVENLKDLIDGKNTGKWSNTQAKTLGSSDPTHTPEYKAKLAEQQKIESEKASAKAAMIAQQKAESAKSLAAYPSLKKQAPVPTPAQKSAIGTYGGSGYQSINNNLRQGKDDAVTKTVKDLDSYLANSEIPDDMVVFRGVGGDYAKALKSLLAPGASFIDRGFSSTTASSDLGFGGGHSADGLHFRIELPKGSKGAAVGDYTGHENEKEILLPRNTMFKVKTYDRKTGEITVTVDQSQVGQDQAQDAEFEESKHPRAENGQFGSGGAGAASSVKEKLANVPVRPKEDNFLEKYHTEKYSESSDEVNLKDLKEHGVNTVTSENKSEVNPYRFNQKKSQSASKMGLILADPSKIYFEGQPSVNKGKVEYFAEHYDPSPDDFHTDEELRKHSAPSVTLLPNGNMLSSDHHRLVAQILRGDKEVYVRASTYKQGANGELEQTKTKSNIKKSKPQGSDSFAMDRATVRRIDDDGHLFVEQTPISKANVCPYYGKEIPDFHALGLDPEKTYKLYRDPEELKKAAASFAGKPLLLVHTAISSDEHPREVVVGSIGDNVEFKAPYLMAPLSIWDGEAIGLVQSGKQKELSSAYRYRADMTPGKADGESYDGVMRDIGGNHVALVKEGRAGPDVVVGDSKQEIPMKKTTLLSRKAVLAQGALMAYFSPKLAQDAKLAIAPMLVGVNAQNYSAKIPSLVKSLTAASKGKLAQDADIADLVELLDGLKDGDMPVEDAMEPNDGTVENKTMKARGYDAVKEILKDKLSAEDMKACDDAMEDDGDDQEAMDEDQDDEDDDKKDKKEKPAEDEEVKEEKVTKKAMDAAIAKSVRLAQDEMRKSQREIEEAKEIVLPYVGKLAMAHDSAADVYRTALTALNVNVDDVHPSAFKAIIVNLPKPGSQQIAPASRVAMDEKSVSSFTEMYPTAGAVKHL